MSAQMLWWKAAGCPAHTYSDEQPASGFCATCATPIESGVPRERVITHSFANHSDLLNYGTHICPACAWLYTIGKGQPGSLIAAGERYWRPMIGYGSATEERPQWLTALREIADMPADTPVAGVLTADTKPRLWPRAVLCSVGRFGMYVHCGDYNISEFRLFDLNRCIEIAEIITGAIAKGWTKQLILGSLFNDYKRASKDMPGTIRLEAELHPLRQSPEFVPALLIAGMRKDDRSNIVAAAPDTRSNPSPVQSRADRAAGPERIQRGRGKRADAGSLSLFDFD